MIERGAARVLLSSRLLRLAAQAFWNQLAHIPRRSIAAVQAAVRTWTAQVGRFIALTEFSRQKFIAAGLAADTIGVKPHVVHSDPSARDGRFWAIRWPALARKGNRKSSCHVAPDNTDNGNVQQRRQSGVREGVTRLGRTIPVLCRIYTDAMATRHGCSGAM